MGEIFVDGIDEYVDGLLPERDDVLLEMEAQARKRNIPIVGPAVGRLFYQLAKMIGARTVFELGSAIGYSTIWWARAVGEGGRVIYTDGSKENAAEARGYFERAGVADRIEVRVGWAQEEFAKEDTQFDIVFNDVDKEGYPEVLRLVPPRVRKGGLFVTDNTLWHGRVIAPKGSKEAEMATTKAVLEFNQSLYTSREFFTTLLPLRDGVSVALRL